MFSATTRRYVHGMLAGLCGIAALQQPLANAQTTLPSAATTSAIEALSDLIDPEVTSIERDYRTLMVSEPSPGVIRRGGGERVDVQFVETSTMFLLFEPDASESQIRNYIEDNNVILVRTFPNIGAIQVRTDLAEYFVPAEIDADANDTLLRGLTEAIRDFQNDPIVRSAAPDLVLREQGRSTTQRDGLLTPMDIVESDAASLSEVIDWGIADIEADQLWSLPGARDGVLFGVMDTGFARHEDIIFLELPPNTSAQDHGNHVAGIACGQHNNRGIRGVLPNCFVRARTADVFFESTQGGRVDRFYVVFSQVLATLTEFVESQEDVHTFNVSLGYNWRPNFRINPDLPNVQSERVRLLVEAQGTILVPLLEAAADRGKTIFSAAGNDSFGLADPISARYSSPFNWAAITARERGIRNGVVVEAHDENGRRAEFSNVGGHISCPGVRVMSALAFGPNGMPSNSAYGVMTGTSMASPYCAASQALLRLVTPERSGVEAIDCMLASTAVSSSGTPMLRLTEAKRACD